MLRTSAAAEMATPTRESPIATCSAERARVACGHGRILLLCRIICWQNCFGAFTDHNVVAAYG
jgi:hypothetical protein